MVTIINRWQCRVHELQRTTCSDVVCVPASLQDKKQWCRDAHMQAFVQVVLVLHACVAQEGWCCNISTACALWLCPWPLYISLQPCFLAHHMMHCSAAQLLLHQWILFLAYLDCALVLVAWTGMQTLLSCWRLPTCWTCIRVCKISIRVSKLSKVAASHLACGRLALAPLCLAWPCPCNGCIAFLYNNSPTQKLPCVALAVHCLYGLSSLH